jgi:hypothetical protein
MLSGVKQRPSGTGPPSLKPAVVTGNPQYDLTLLKAHFGLLTLKGYTKGERVLRFEAIARSTRTLKTGRALHKFPEITARLAGMAERFGIMLDRADTGFIPAARTITALLTLRDHVIAPILAGIRHPGPGHQPAHGPG